jgi:uncharacterized protein
MGNKHIYIEELDGRIIRFLKKHHVLTLATAKENKPYCCSCFYVFNEKENTFVVTSDNDTRHVKEVLAQPAISGAIALETTMVGKIQGVQFTGTMTLIEGEDFSKAKSLYLKRFPVAAFAELVLWRIDADYLKYTDNRLGFGKKMIWEKKS